MKKLATPGLIGTFHLSLIVFLLSISTSGKILAQCVDLAPPVPVCHQSLAIPLNNVGVAIIPASAFDAASTDDCGHVFFKVKRMSLPVGYTCANPGNPNNMFDDYIQFCCEDIPNNDIMVILRVYDTPPVPGPVPDDYLQGDFNDCMVSVEVQDKLPPTITCPSDLTISCEFPFTMGNLSVFGNVVTSPDDQELICIDDPGVPGDPGLQCIGIDGLALDNCNVVISSTAEADINSCGVGTLTRTFTAVDDGGLEASCVQVISIINYNLFDESDIAWPPDYTTFDICEVDSLDPEDLPPPFNEPVLNEGPCDLVAATYEDLVFDLSNSDEACFKILRTWTVIDWCQINTQSGGIWTHLQVIKVMNTVAPVIAPIADINECSFDPACGGLTLDFVAEATDDCSGPASLTWRYSVDFDSDNVFDFISNTIIGESIQFTLDVPIGSHRILYVVWDQCGNSAAEEQLVTVESCKGPSAKCIHGLSTSLMAMDLDGDGTADWGMVAVQAEMFDAGSDHPCGNAITLSFSEDPSDVTRIFDCTDVGDNEVELWVIDENGLTDFCITTIDIQDNSNVCPPGLGVTGVISGNLSVQGVGPLSGATVYLDGSNMPGSLSGVNGYFVFPAMPYGGQYNVRPAKTGDFLNGVTTLDLVKIQKHLLGLESFSSPVEYIAADANNSHSVSAIDIVQLRRLILGHYSELPNNESWRFVDAGHIFPDPANPWTSLLPETYTIDPFNNNMTDVNFNAIKIGDLNLSANLQSTNIPIIPRTNEICQLSYTTEQHAEPGLYEVVLRLDNSGKYNALQFAFDWNQSEFELVDWTAGANVSSEDFRLPSLDNPSISLATFNTEGFQLQDDVLMRLWFKRNLSGSSKVKLNIRQEPTSPVAYSRDNESGFRIQLIERSTAQTHIINHPNPFKDKTLILYISDRSELAYLRISDMSGRIVLNKSVHLVTGENEFIVKKSDLTGPGVYAYEIESPFQHSTNRMIIVD